jgi:hypothetical protein
MKPEIEAIVGAMPPPGKMRKPGGAAEDPAEESAMAVASALGIPTEKVDAKALAEALRDFVKTAG